MLLPGFKSPAKAAKSGSSAEEEESKEGRTEIGFLSVCTHKAEGSTKNAIFLYLVLSSNHQILHMKPDSRSSTTW